RSSFPCRAPKSVRTQMQRRQDALDTRMRSVFGRGLIGVPPIPPQKFPTRGGGAGSHQMTVGKEFSLWDRSLRRVLGSLRRGRSRLQSPEGSGTVTDGAAGDGRFDFGHVVGQTF